MKHNISQLTPTNCGFIFVAGISHHRAYYSDRCLCCGDDVPLADQAVSLAPAASPISTVSVKGSYYSIQYQKAEIGGQLGLVDVFTLYARSLFYCGTQGHTRARESNVRQKLKLCAFGSNVVPARAAFNMGP